jgi:hypothetical protein
MAIPISNCLKEILNDFNETTADIKFNALRDRIILQNKSNSDCLIELIGEVAICFRYGALLIHLLEIAKRDSVVRDIITVGHAAKLLSRISVLGNSNSYDIICWPHRLFDRISQNDRLQYFERERYFPMKAGLNTNPEISSLFNNEINILEKHKL